LAAAARSAAAKPSAKPAETDKKPVADGAA
jgi:hypothetical protein